MPRLRVHDIYAGALQGAQGRGHQALQQRLQEARWFIKNIQQRFDTILRVSRAIVERQKNFFVHGELAMRPLVLREIADELGLHESTISRVTTAKYMATPFGTFELKYFFRLGAGHRDRRQCVQHRGARADQAVCRQPRARRSR
jgi:RNA polymerase sigma-54 factor